MTDTETYGRVTICRGPEMHEVKRWDEGIHWCFVCRKRVQFWQIVKAPSMEDLIAWMGFYSHSRTIECERGHLNGDLFPGRWREWDE